MTHQPYKASPIRSHLAHFTLCGQQMRCFTTCAISTMYIVIYSHVHPGIALFRVLHFWGIKLKTRDMTHRVQICTKKEGGRCRICEGSAGFLMLSSDTYTCTSIYNYIQGNCFYCKTCNISQPVI